MADICAMRIMLYGEGDVSPIPLQAEQLCTLLFENNIMGLVINNLVGLAFEVQKDGVHIINYLLTEKHKEGIAAFQNDPSLLTTLSDGCTNVHISLHCNSILKNVITDEGVLARFLAENYSKFIENVQIATFDVASNNFSTLKASLTQEEKVVAKFLNSDVEKTRASFVALLKSKNQVTKRMSIPLIGGLIEEKENAPVRAAFLASEECCNVMCELLTGKAKAIQKETLPIFANIIDEMAAIPSIRKLIFGHKNNILAGVQQFEEKPKEPGSDSDDEEPKRKDEIELERNVQKVLKFLDTFELAIWLTRLVQLCHTRLRKAELQALARTVNNASGAFWVRMRYKNAKLRKR